MTFDTWEEAEEAFYKSEDCLSDDPDKEEGRLMRWMEDCEHQVLEDYPYMKNEAERLVYNDKAQS